MIYQILFSYVESSIIKRLKKILKLLVVFFLLLIIIKAFFIGVYKIPTSSMENTLLPGDFILVNVAAYKLNTPSEIPLLGLPVHPLNLFNFSKPKVNDIVLIELPSFYTSDYSKHKTHIIKRIIAGPGDTLQIINKKIFVNGIEKFLPSTAKHYFEGIKPSSVESEGIFYKGSGWSGDNYGPIVIPAEGDTIPINPKNIHIWKQLIVLEYNELVVREEGSVVTIDDKPAQNYIVKKDHYFVIGDNFDNSRDSRYIGFINEDLILGKVMFVYWSMDPYKRDGSFFSRIRWERIFKRF